MNEFGMTSTEARHLMRWDCATRPVHEGTIQYVDIDLGRGENGKLDLSLVSGVGNMKQQITTALATALGSDPLNMNHGFAGFRALSEERDPMLLRERLRFAVLEVLQRDGRVIRVLRVLIGDEIIAFHSGSDAPAAPKSGYGIVDIEAQFVIRSGQTLNVTVGPILGGA